MIIAGGGGEGLWVVITPLRVFFQCSKALTPDCSGFCWMCFSLPLCPPRRIEEAFLLLEDEIPSFATPALEAFATELLAYIRRTYMCGQYGTEATGYNWNFYHQIDETHQQLTNNPSEGANHRLAVRCKTAHPGIYPFFGVIVKEQ